MKKSALLTIGMTTSSCTTKALDVQASKDPILTAERINRIKKSPHFNGKTFNNLIKTDTGLKPGMKMEALRKWIGGDQERVPKKPIPVMQPTLSKFNTGSEKDLKVIWLGHSSLLIEIEGKNILIDPVWSTRASPFSFIGPKRFFAPPIDLTSLPKLYAVLISHDHYDHLDEDCIKYLAKTGVVFYVPLGVSVDLENWGVSTKQIKEMDWWDMAQLSDKSITFISTPARHCGGRGPLLSNQTFWTSWVIIGANHRLYFSGDSGMQPTFKEIGRKYGPFNYTFLDTGAYDKCWSDIHMNPDQALIAHEDLKGDVLMPIHWGTYSLSYHSWYEPVEWLSKEATKKSVKVAIPKPGQILTVDQLPPNKKWWRSVIA